MYANTFGKALTNRGIEAFVYEAAAGAQPETVLDTSLREVRGSDVFVGLFFQKFPEVTTKEFSEARSLKKPCFIYVREKNVPRDAELESFLRSEVYDLEKGVSYAFFDSSLKLAEQIGDDVLAWLVRRHRELTAEVNANRVSKDELARLQTRIYPASVHHARFPSEGHRH